MKKLTFLGTMLLAAALIFTGCNDTKDPTSASFDDCSETITTADDISFADGNWTIKAIMAFEGMNGEYTIKATVTDGKYTFTSGTGKMIMDLADEMDSEALAAFNQLTDEQKKAMVMENMNEDMFPADASISFSGTKMTVTAALDEETLSGMQSEMDFSNLPSDATIKTNSDKTKYVISITDDEGTETIYISKD